MNEKNLINRIDKVLKSILCPLGPDKHKDIKGKYECKGIQFAISVARREVKLAMKDEFKKSK